ncbi:MAG: hypothetical protein ACR2NG_09350 [Acidimicrobiia bacterium]
MKRFRILVPALLVTLVAVGCSSDDVSATTCDEVVDETMQLLQNLIDDVDKEFVDLAVADFQATEGDLPSLAAFEEDAQQIDEIAAELGCTQSQISTAVGERVGELTATTDLGRFLIDAVRSGGI